MRRVAGELHALIVVSPETEARLARQGYRTTLPGLALAPTRVSEDTFRTFHSFDNPVSGIRATLSAWTSADTLIHEAKTGYKSGKLKRSLPE